MCNKSFIEVKIEKTKSKKIRENNKGITLIALVVTIIVLIILSGVTIALLKSDNGIITQGLIAKEETEEAQLEEKHKFEDFNNIYERNKRNQCRL